MNSEIRSCQNSEIYRIFVESAERNIDRRSRTNQFYFSIVSALFIAYSYLAEGKLRNLFGSLENASQSSQESQLHALPLWMLPLLLLIVSMSWFSLLVNFRTLSRAKYAVICEFEKNLPYQPFTEEWAEYKRIRTVEITQLEIAMPLLFYVVGLLGLILPFLGMR